jgi:hypothetical protein
VYEAIQQEGVMRFVLFGVLFLIGMFLLIGRPTTIKVEIPVEIPKLEIPKLEIPDIGLVQPEVKPLPSSIEFSDGYWDGYSQAWVGPISWTLSSRYRQGWTAGDRDRDAGREPQYRR